LILAGALPDTPLGALTVLPDLPAAFNGACFEERGKRREGKGLKGGEGIG